MSTFPNLNKWMECYRSELIKSREANPDRYLWADEKLPDILEQMRAGFQKGPGQYNKDSQVILAVCRHFGIPRTYRTIDDFLRGKK